MKYVMSALLMMFSYYSGAQYVCKIFQQIPGRENRRCVLTATYDERGRPVKESVRGYAVYLEDAYSMCCCKEDGIYDYYYDDTILYKQVMTELDDRTRLPFDSGKVFYHYDSSNGILKDFLTVRHLMIRRPGKKPGGYRNTVTYDYNSDGTIAVKNGVHGTNTAEYLRYDSKHRVISDSIAYFDDGFKLVTKYVYTYDGYKKYQWSNDRRYPEVTVYRTDEQGRVTDKATWLHRNEDIDGGHSVRSFNWGLYLGGDLKRFRQFERTVTSYNETGRIAETQYYFEGRHTTTHVYVYEKPGLAGS